MEKQVRVCTGGKNDHACSKRNFLIALHAFDKHGIVFLYNAYHPDWSLEARSTRQGAFENDVIEKEPGNKQQVIAPMLFFRNRGYGCMAFRRNELYLVETVANLLYIVQNTHVVQNV